MWALFPSGPFRTNGTLRSFWPFGALLSSISLRTLVARVPLLTWRALDALLASRPLWAHISFWTCLPRLSLIAFRTLLALRTGGACIAFRADLSLFPGLSLWTLISLRALRSRWPLELADALPVHQVFRPDVDRVVIFRAHGISIPRLANGVGGFQLLQCVKSVSYHK